VRIAIGACLFPPEPKLNDTLSNGSVGLVHIPFNERENIMLARRFTIVCLIATLFAMGMIALIEHTARPAYSLIIDNSLPCVIDATQRCARQ
jgi:hypothetical protein